MTYTNLTFHEDDYLDPVDSVSYVDETIVFHLITRRLYANINCSEPRLMFRIVYTDGTSTFIEVQNHTITPKTFCRPPIPTLGNVPANKYLVTVKTVLNYILLIYYRFDNDNDSPLTYGMMIEWNGNIKRFVIQ